MDGLFDFLHAAAAVIDSQIEKATKDIEPLPVEPPPPPPPAPPPVPPPVLKVLATSTTTPQVTPGFLLAYFVITLFVVLLALLLIKVWGPAKRAAWFVLCVEVVFLLHKYFLEPALDNGVIAEALMHIVTARNVTWSVLARIHWPWR